MEKQRVMISEYEYKGYRKIIALLFVAVVVLWIVQRHAAFAWYDALFCTLLLLIAVLQFMTAIGKADCFIEFDDERLGIKLVDESKPQQIKIANIQRIVFLPERRLLIEINEGSYLFKYRNLKSEEIDLIESTLADFAEKHNIELKK